MSQIASAGQPNESHGPHKPMTRAQLRHDIRNHLNAIKLCSAILQRRHSDSMTQETLRDVDLSVERINQLVGSHLTDQTEP